MAYNLVRLAQLTGSEKYASAAAQQLDYLSGEAARYPAGHTMFLLALLDKEMPPPKVTVVPAGETIDAKLPLRFPLDAAVSLLRELTKEYLLKDGKTTFYICANNSCLPPVNDLSEVF